MKVLYDYQIFQWQAYGGISRYFYELMKDHKETGRLDFELALKYSPNFYLKNSTFAAEKAIDPDTMTIKDFLPTMQFRGKGRLFSLYSKLINNKFVDTWAENRSVSIAAIKKGDFDVLHCTNYDPYFLDHIGNKPYVITFYDLIHEIFPELMMWDTSYVPRRKLAENAAKIIAISQKTKDDLVKIYDIDPEKIVVTHLASSLDTMAENPALNLPEKFILHVGNREFYKNFYFFARVFAKLAEADPELRLVCAGGGGFKPNELEFFDILGVKEKIIFAGSDDASIATCYKKALALITPTYYEGFNIPVIEAFSAGCPVVASNTGSTPEAGGDAAVYFDPKDLAAMKVAISDVIYNTDTRKQLIQKGTERAKLFSWRKTAEQTRSIYESIV
ncbi:MAG: glycosyltransferase family 4 protein [Candidatus Doudnabacteria bacterium]|nr:glycosyltransferase family 4 protein [Candidatus Doudnabacteria bacterium]